MAVQEEASNGESSLAWRVMAHGRLRSRATWDERAQPLSPIPLPRSLPRRKNGVGGARAPRSKLLYSWEKIGAGDANRTRDPNLGKVMVTRSALLATADPLFPSLWWGCLSWADEVLSLANFRWTLPAKEAVLTGVRC